MLISNTRRPLATRQSSAHKAASEASATPDHSPTESVTLSGYSEASPVRKAIPFVTGALGLAAGVALGATGGIAGAVGALPMAAAATVGLGGLGLAMDLVENSEKNMMIGAGIGLAAGAVVVGAGAFGGVVGGIAVGGSLGVLGFAGGKLLAVGDR